MVRSSKASLVIVGLVVACGAAGARLLAACGGSVSTGGDAGGSTSSSTSSSGAACNLVVYGNSPTCQSWLDGVCCAEQKACAEDSACTALVACVNACPEPRTGPCLNMCGGTSTSSAEAEFKAIVTCAQGASPPASCAWP